MVKKWVIMTILAIILIVSSVYESKYINASMSGLINSLETLQIELTENKEKIDSENLIKKSYQIHNEWHDKLSKLKCLLWHTGLKDIEVGLARIAVYIEENDYTESYAEVACLIDYLAHYLDDFKVTLDNIF